MISRRQIIREQQDSNQRQVGPIQTLSSSSSSSSTKQSASSSGQSGSGAGGRAAQASQQTRGPSSALQVAGKAAGRKLAARAKLTKEELQQQRQQQLQDSSDGYVVNQFDDYALADARHHQAKDYWRPGELEAQQDAQQAAGYRYFDPYSVHEEEDVWYSEERLFEDHLEEIFNKWRLLDDDIWCKLIIMERNRRIGKAYARVPIVTVDGSHELSYDGYKLALNGFDNPDRDLKTEECRKRIGKGIRIKMDNLGNILIKRLSKSGVYIKEWIQSPNGSSNSTSGRMMPSRQQLIKNQNAMLAAMGSGNGRPMGSQVSSSIATSGTPSSSSGGSSMEPSNDSAVCDEVISIGGRLDQDKIYVMFDMKKFQANITQELCRPYPDKRKLEQQCFSIVGLARDAEDILNLPCWVMVINIVAIEMLNERFPLMTDCHTSFPDSMLMDSGRRNAMAPPNFVSIFEQNNNNTSSNNNNSHGNNHERSQKDDTGKEEDPYSLPANASSSDVKSSINDYSTTSTKNISALMDSNGHPVMSSRHYGGSKRAEMYAHKAQKEMSRNGEPLAGSMMKQRSKSQYNIYGPPMGKSHQSRYNNSSSIYSPGHMLVPPPSDSIPPKLPPRDFVKKGKSKSSSNVNNDNLDRSNNENIYSTGLTSNGNLDLPVDAAKVRKTKKNRFLESLKAPLELAKSNRSASVLGAPVQPFDGAAAEKKAAKAKGFTKSSTKNLKSFLGVKGSSKSRDTVSDESNYVHVDGDSKKLKGKKVASDGNAEADSVVDSTEDIDDNPHEITQSASSASYNDLDIPTPDYETDENIYALDDGAYIQSGRQKDPDDIRRLGASGKGLKSSKAHNKEDLYYSGFLAHVPQNIGCNTRLPGNNGKHSSVYEDKLSCLSTRDNSRFLVHNNRMMASSKLSGRDMIYGSTTGLPSAAGSRYRSASMQRYYPRAQTAGSQMEMYDLESENLYGMSGSVDAQGQYGVSGHRRRSGSKIANHMSANKGGPLYRVASSMANSNYDIGRSSSGIYGNNSSSSSCDYADWHPQMRKVNSSGYLNSIFKNHVASPVDSFNTNVLKNNNNNGNSNKSNPLTVHNYNNTQRNYTSRTLKSARPTATLSKQQSQQQQQQKQQQPPPSQHPQKHQQVASTIVNGPNYRSYDSSNDSEPSYTNSSDGLDIYDQIGAHARLNHPHQFLDMTAAHNIPPEIHVGEWENMYDR